MKVYEIISEQQVNEGLVGSAANFVGGLFGSQRSKLVAELGELLANKGKWSGAATEKEALKALKKKFGPKAVQMAQQDKTIVSDALKTANKVRDPSMLQKVGGALSKTAGATTKWNLLEKGVAGALNLWSISEFIKPFMEFREQMANAQSQVDANHWTQANYQAALNQQSAILITKWASLLVVGKLWGKVFEGPLGQKFMTKFPILGRTLIQGGKNYIARDWITNDTNSKAIAAWIATEIPGLADALGGAVSPFLKPLLAGASSGASSTDTSGAGGNGGAAPSGTTTGTTPQQDIGSTSTPGAADNKPAGDIDPNTGKTKMGRKMWSVDPTAVNNYDITGWVQKPGDPHSIVDPKDPSRFLPKPDTYTWTPG